MDDKSTVGKRTQAQRRAATRASLLASACRLFGERGFAATSLEDIADDCGLTIRPVYYHFGSKRGLFVAVNAATEQPALRALDCATAGQAWDAFMSLCDDPAFRRIILQDAPDILSRERWSCMKQLPWAWELVASATDRSALSDEQKAMCERLALATLTEAAMVVMENGNDASTRQDAARLITRLLSGEIPGGQQADVCRAPEPGCVNA